MLPLHPYGDGLSGLQFSLIELTENGVFPVEAPPGLRTHTSHISPDTFVSHGATTASRSCAHTWTCALARAFFKTIPHPTLTYIEVSGLFLQQSTGNTFKGNVTIHSLQPLATISNSANRFRRQIRSSVGQDKNIR